MLQDPQTRLLLLGPPNDLFPILNPRPDPSLRNHSVPFFQKLLPVLPSSHRCQSCRSDRSVSPSPPPTLVSEQDVLEWKKIKGGKALFSHLKKTSRIVKYAEDGMWFVCDCGKAQIGASKKRAYGTKERVILEKDGPIVDSRPVGFDSQSWHQHWDKCPRNTVRKAFFRVGVVDTDPTANYTFLILDQQYKKGQLFVQGDLAHIILLTKDLSASAERDQAPDLDEPLQLLQTCCATSFLSSIYRHSSSHPNRLYWNSKSRSYTIRVSAFASTQARGIESHF